MLIAYQVCKEMIEKLRPILPQLRKQNAHIADQLERAASNTLLNLGEGQRRLKGNKRRAYENAHGEAREVLAALDCALCWGWIVDTSDVRATLDRLLALCWGLTHGPARTSRASASRP